MKIYLAGKVEKMCWRHDIVKDLRNYDITLGNWPILKGVVFGHDYVGPYFTKCDHGCYHGSDQHGNLDVTIDCISARNTRPQVVKACLNAIHRADLVFAWLPKSAKGAYGTIFELGYAKALGKCVVIGTNCLNDIPNLWFSTTAADCHLRAAKAQNALMDAIYFAEGRRQQ